MSKNGVGIMNAYPAPTPGYLAGTQNWVAQANHPINQRKEVVNIDLNPSAKHHISGRRSSATYFEYQPFDQGSGETGKCFNRPNQTNSVSWVYTISPTLVNEARATFSLDDVYIPVNTALSGFNRSTFGINYPYIFAGKDLTGKIPTVTVPNFYGLAGGPYPSHSSGPIWTGADSLTKVWKNHTFKAGFSFEYSGENDGDQINVSTVPGGSNNQNGSFVFTDTRTGLGATSGIGMANLALGLADSYTEIGPRAYTIWRGSVYEAFAQDSWKVSEKLHVEYGIRMTSIQGYHPLWGNGDYFDGNLYNPSQAVRVDPVIGNVILGTGNPYNGVVIPGFSSFPSSAQGRVLAASSNICNGASCSGLFAPSLGKRYIDTANVWQPRIGIAYQASPKTVIRAGAGRFATRMGLLDNIFSGGNSPFQPFVTVTNVSVDNPPAALVANPGISANYLRPYKGFAAIQEEESVVNSTYKSLQITWNRRFTNGSSFGFTYTLSKSMDSGSQYRDIAPDTFNTSNLWGPSDYDARHMAIINYIYELPFLEAQKNLSGKLLGAWSIAGTAQFQTGGVGSIRTGNDYAGVGEVGSMNGSSLQYWVLNSPGIITTGAFAGPVTTSSSPRYLSFATNPTAPPTGTFNLAPGVRNAVYLPGFQDWNLSLFKTFAVNERSGFQFRAECYDFPNHPNLGNPNGTPTSSQFGMITAKSGLVRTLQLSLRFYF